MRVCSSTCRAFATVVLLALACLYSRTIHADWINLSGAEVAPNVAEFYVHDDGVRVVLEVYVGDLDTFIDLVPAHWIDSESVTLPSEEERLSLFAQHGISIAADGQTLPVDLVLVEPRLRKDRQSPYAGMINPQTGTRVPTAPEDKRVLYVELFYPFGASMPDTLQIRPPQDDSGEVAASVGMIVYHREVPVIDFRFLSREATLNLNWQDPWFSKFDNAVLTRHHRFPAMAFIYAEPYEIRYEALVRVRDALRWTGSQANPGSYLQENEASQLLDATAEFLRENSPLLIDGVPVQADLDRAAYMRIGLAGLELLQPSDPVDVSSILLGVIYSVPTDGYPQTASVEWTQFDESIPEVRGNAIDRAGPFLEPLTPDQPILRWTNHFTNPQANEIVAVDASEWGAIKVPTLSVAFGLLAFGFLCGAVRRGRTPRRIAFVSLAAGALIGGWFARTVVEVPVGRPETLRADLTDEHAEELVHDLLWNVYRAFDFRGEEQVYDRLALTIEGPLLENVYLQQRESLRVSRAGGARARVTALNVEDVTVIPVEGVASDFKVAATWQISGSVGHWGHVHQRRNAYAADITISAESGNWRIAGFDMREQTRLDGAVAAR